MLIQYECRNNIGIIHRHYDWKRRAFFTYGRRCKTEWIINRRNVEGIYMKKRKATLCLLLWPLCLAFHQWRVFKDSGITVGRMKRPLKARQARRCRGADGSGDGSGSSGESTAIKEAGPDPNASVFAGEEMV